MGKITLYGVDASPPVRAVLLTLNALDLPYEYKQVDLFGGEHHTEEYRKLNPTGTVPALIDDDKPIGDSHAIIAYLASKYGKKDDSLYPRDLYQRSIVDQRLYYEAAVVFERSLKGITKPLVFLNDTNVPQYKIDNIAEVYEAVNRFLQHHPYTAGDQLTIADLSLISSITSMQAILASDPVKYPNLVAWIKRMEQLPYYEKANGKGLKQITELIKSKNIKIVP